MSGDAIDFKVKGITGPDLADLSAEVLRKNKLKGGIGTYKGNFVHVDTRGYDARWGPHVAHVYK